MIIIEFDNRWDWMIIIEFDDRQDWMIIEFEHRNALIITSE